MSGDWETVIGLEIHAQLATSSKIFSGASTAYGAAPKANTKKVRTAASQGGRRQQQDLEKQVLVGSQMDR